MTPKNLIVVAIMAMLFTMPLTSLDFDFLEDDSRVAQGPGGGGNNGTSITIPANQTFAWESVISMGSLHDDFALDIQVSPVGNVFILGVASSDFYINPSCSVAHNQSANNPMPFVAKFDRNGTCIWTAEVDAGQIDSVQTHNVDYGKITIDSNENVYLVLSFQTISGTATSISFGAISHSFTPPTSNMNTVAKIDYNGSWEWVVTPPSVAPYYTSGRSAITIDTNDNLWISYMTGGSHEMKISKFNTSGVLQASSATFGVYGSNSVVRGHDLDTDSFGNVYLAGTYANSVSFVLKNG
ncbi:MAG: hypothetical protein ACKVKS_07770, partial [Candidatus Poseidoniales archaeon]